MYYFLIIISVIIFGGCFLLKDKYREKRGSSLKISLQFSFTSSIAGLIALFFINGLKFEFTMFTFIMALLNTINGILFTFCSFKALGIINLSLFSLFSMLGGMMLPFLQGIIFFGEGITTAKIICVVLISIALLMTVQKGDKKRGTIYYAGIFILNGMSGVLSKIFTSAPFEKTSPEGYSILCTLCTIIMSLLILLIFFREKDENDKPRLSTLAISAGSGIFNRLANLILVIALAHVDASVQYPMVTGGVMIVSTLLCYFGDKRPSKMEIWSIVVSFAGLLALFAIPV